MESIMHDYVYRFDKSVGYAIKLLPDWLGPLMKVMTFIGQPIVMLPLAAAILLTAYLKTNYALAKVVLFGFATFGINTLIKFGVHRERPDTLFAHSMKIKSWSFPSGHAFLTMFFFGLLAYLAFVHLTQPWNVSVCVLLCTATILVGISRVYLGAHFPSDVLAGWLFGGLCLLLAINIFKV